MAAGFGIGYCTSRFKMPKNRLELTLNPKGTQIVERDEKIKSSCSCQTLRGITEQIPSMIISSAPSHWEQPRVFSSFEE